jgi:hypothetical protein
MTSIRDLLEAIVAIIRKHLEGDQKARCPELRYAYRPGGTRCGGFSRSGLGIQVSQAGA